MNLLKENYGDLRKTPLFFAISNGDVTCAKLLLAAGARTELDPLRCILVAVRAERYTSEAPVSYFGACDDSFRFAGTTSCSCCCPTAQT